VLCLLVLAYSVVVAGQILLGVLFCALAYGLFLAYYLLGAFVRLVDSIERIADALEARGDEGRLRDAVDARSGDARSRGERSRSGGSRDHPEDRW
jgi:hypothetical protein